MKKICFYIIICLFIVFISFSCNKDSDEKTQIKDPSVEPTQGNETLEEVKYIVTFDNEGMKEIVEVKEGEKVSKPLDPVKEGYIFTGWYIGDKELITLYDFEKAVTTDITLVAIFEEMINEVLVIEKISYQVYVGDIFEIEYKVENSNDETIVVFEPDSNIIEIEDNTITAIKSGISYIKVYLPSNIESYKIVTIEVLQKPQPEIIAEDVTSEIPLFTFYQLNVTLINSDSSLVYQSSDETILTIDENGYCEALNEGSSIITVYLKDDESIYAEFKIDVVIDPFTIFEILNINNVLVKNVTTYGENPKTQNQLVLGSVSRYSFADLNIIEEIVPIDNNEYTGLTATEEMLKTAEPMKLVRPGILLEELKYIVYHDTGNAASGADAKMHANYMVSKGNRENRARSWHYTVGDDYIYHHIPNNEVTWQGDSYDAYAKSIGIETCVNYGADLYKVWQNAGKLMASLLNENNLTVDSIKQHYDMNGKNCPQTLRMNNLYKTAISLIEGELLVLQLLDDYDIKFESLNLEYLDNTGKVIKQPETTMRLAYKITVTKNGNSSCKVFYSQIEGKDKSKLDITEESIAVANDFDNKVISSNITASLSNEDTIEQLVNEYYNYSDDVKALIATKDLLFTTEYNLFKQLSVDTSILINEVYTNLQSYIISYNYIELYNTTNEVINLDGYQIVINYNNADYVYIIKNGIIYPNGTFLIAFGDVFTNDMVDSKFPLPDAAFNDSLPSDNYSVTLKSDENIIDVLGVNNSLIFEESSFKFNANNLSINRKHYIDTNNNNRDFCINKITPVNSFNEIVDSIKVNSSVYTFDYKVILYNKQLALEDEPYLEELLVMYESLNTYQKGLVSKKELLDSLFIELEGIKNPSIAILYNIMSTIPYKIVNDYKLPDVEGVSYELANKKYDEYYSLETGEYLKVSYEARVTDLIITHGNETMSKQVNFGLAEPNDKIIYNTGAVKSGNGKTSDGYGDYYTQLSKTGFGNVAIRVDGKIYFIGKNCLINLMPINGSTSLTKKDLRPLGGEGFINNCGIVNGIPKEYAGTGALYNNISSQDLSFDLSNTYGRNNSGSYGYYKVIFTRNPDGNYYVSNILPDTGTNDTTKNYIVTLKPNEYLWCPHTYETNVDGGTWLISPSSNTSGGVLKLNAKLEIIHYGN